MRDAADSIDYNDANANVSWEIDIFMEKKLYVPSLAALYEKYLPKLRDFVVEQKIELNGDYSEPSLDWVFVRKYAGTTFDPASQLSFWITELTSSVLCSGWRTPNAQAAS